MPWWRKKKRRDEGRKDKEDVEEDDFLTTPYRPDMVAPFGFEFELLMRELNRALEQMINDEEFWKGGSRVYGFSVTIGPDGRPVIREFGGRPKRYVSELRGAEEGEVTRNYDVIDLGDQVEVIAELKEATKENSVKVEGKGNKVVIEAGGKRSVIRLTYEVRSKPMKVIVRNNVIDAVFKKK